VTRRHSNVPCTNRRSTKNKPQLIPTVEYATLIHNRMNLTRISRMQPKLQCEKERNSGPPAPKNTVYRRPVDQKLTTIDSDSGTSHSHTYSKKLDKSQSHATKTGVRKNEIMNRQRRNVPCTSSRLMNNQPQFILTVEQATLIYIRMDLTRDSRMQPKL
jgi:hypothetical protein